MSDETFKVGEIGILQNLSDWPGKYNGEEAEVVAGLEKRFVQYLHGSFGLAETYIISFGGLNVAIKPSNLRKKRPPSEVDSILRELEVA